jgi:hypothetical protein
MQRLASLAALAFSTFLASTVVLAQRPCGDALRVTVAPERPRQGTLFHVRVAGRPKDASLEGRVAGEPLHFRAVADSLRGESRQEAHAAIPVDSAGSLGAVITCAARGLVDTVRVTIPVAAGEYPLEKLRVAPRFSATPDSALLARQALEAKRAAAVSAAAHDTPRLWTRPFIVPREARVTSRFGRGREFNGAVTSRHMGTDYAGATGAPVRAANRGVVRLVDAFFLGGNVVYIDHGEGLVSAYLHLSRQLVAPGDTVERGAVIGRVGATGRVTGPHLHFILRFGEVSVDPQGALALLGARDARPATTGAKSRARGGRKQYEKRPRS